MSAESALEDAVRNLVTAVEACGAAVIAFGALFSFVRLLVVSVREPGTEAFVPVRLDLGRYLALGLEFQLASDVLRTAVSPSFQEIGQLAAIAGIRTALNYFLSREIAEERRQVAEKAAEPAGRSPGGGARRAAAHRAAEKTPGSTPGNGQENAIAAPDSASDHDEDERDGPAGGA